MPLPHSHAPCPSEDDLDRFLASRVETAHQQAVAVHIDECPECQRILDKRCRDPELARKCRRLEELAVSGVPVQSDKRSRRHEEFFPWPVSPQGAQPPRLPGYDELRWLGCGGWGDVWQARDIELDRQVALKVLRMDRFAAPHQDQLRREAQMMAQLPSHTNRVQVFQVLERQGQLVLVMPFVAGGSLEKRSPLPWSYAVRYLHDIAVGLTDLHARGIQHRDIKPANFLWDAVHDRAVLSDYGLATRAGGRSLGRTPGYAAPEVVAGRPDFASDVFALAVSLYWLLTGRLPFAAASEAEMVRRMQMGLPSLDGGLAYVPQPVEQLLRAGLQAEAGRRPSLDEFREDLRRMEMYVLAWKVKQMMLMSPCPVRLSVTVATAPGPRQPFTQVLQRQRGQVFVEAEQEQVVEAVTGNLIRYEVTADTDGYLTVLNFGAEGKVELFLPQDSQASHRIVAGQSAKLITALAPPVGKEHTAVIWTRQPSRLSADEWHERIKASERGQVPVMVEDWTAVVVPVLQLASL